MDLQMISRLHYTDIMKVSLVALFFFFFWKHYLDVYTNASVPTISYSSNYAMAILLFSCRDCAKESSIPQCSRLIH